jgi:hypothetical protein
MAGHVQLRLIGAPADVDAVLEVLPMVLDVTAAGRKPARGAAGQVLQYGTVTAPGAPPADASRRAER